MDTITIPSPTAFLTNSPVPAKVSVASVLPKSPPPKKPIQRNNASSRPSATAGKSNVRAAGVTKPKQTKSRNGCSTCKAKRLKCDEGKPTCQQCQKRNVECGGYKKDYKWRDGITSAPKPKKPFQPPQPSQLTSPSTSPIYPPELPDSRSTNDSEQASAPLLPVTAGPSPPQLEVLHNAAAFPVSPHSGHGMSLHDGYGFSQPFHDLDIPSIGTANSYTDGSGDAFTDLRSKGTASTSPPQLADILSPGTDLNQPPPPNEPRPPDSPRPYQPSGWAPSDFNGQDIAMDDDIEEIERPAIPGTAMEALNYQTFRGNAPSPWAFRAGSPAASVSSSSSSGSESSLIPRPIFSRDLSQMLTGRFIDDTCGILSIKNGATENPWRTMVLPLISTSDALNNAISSLTAFHIAKEQPEVRQAGVLHMVKSFKHAARGFESEQPIALLATILCLAFAESWDQETSTGIQHLRGAKLFIIEAIKRNNSSFNHQDHARLRFLVHTWVYMDVLARLTSFGESDDDGKWQEIMLAVSDPTSDRELDPLLGCAATLFPLIGQVANIVGRAKKMDRNDLSLISEASDLKAVIEHWCPPDPQDLESPEDTTSQVQHSVQTAEAYRWATLLYLHRAVPEIPSKPAETLAKTVLQYLATVPTSSRTTIIHIYPLLVASCEVDDPRDRKFCEGRWAAMSNRLRIGNVDKCIDVVQEVWRRRDEFQNGRMEEIELIDMIAQNHLMSPTEPFGTTGDKKRAFSGDSAADAQQFFSQNNDLNIDQIHAQYASKRRAVDGASYGPIPMRVASIPGQPAPAGTGLSHIMTNGRRRSSALSIEKVKFEYTIRGSLHWLRVMADREWEVLLG